MPYPLTDEVNVATAGTAVQISNTPRRVLGIVFKNPEDNTDTIYVGNDGAADVSPTTGFPLKPGQTLSWDFGKFGISVPISDFWVDAAVSGEDVAYAAEMFT